MHRSQRKFKIKTIILSLILFAIASLNSASYAQLLINSIDFDRIPQKKVRSLVKHQNDIGIKSFSDLKPSCYIEQDSNKYSYHRSSHIIKEKIQKVWNKLKSLRARDEYNSKMLSLGFVYSKQQNKIFYNCDDYRDIEEGSIIFLNLRLLGGIKNIGVALEVTKVDDVNKIIQLCYIDNGMSEGTQQVKLVEDKEGNTQISQETRYRNHSKFREKKLYPFFHQKAVDELHSNIKKLIEGY